MYENWQTVSNTFVVLKYQVKDYYNVFLLKKKAFNFSPGPNPEMLCLIKQILLLSLSLASHDHAN